MRLVSRSTLVVPVLALATLIPSSSSTSLDDDDDGVSPVLLATGTTTRTFWKENVLFRGIRRRLGQRTQAIDASKLHCQVGDGGVGSYSNNIAMASHDFSFWYAMGVTGGATSLGMEEMMHLKQILFAAIHRDLLWCWGEEEEIISNKSSKNNGGGSNRKLLVDSLIQEENKRRFMEKARELRIIAFTQGGPDMPTSYECPAQRTQHLTQSDSGARCVLVQGRMRIVSQTGDDVSYAIAGIRDGLEKAMNSDLLERNKHQLPSIAYLLYMGDTEAEARYDGFSDTAKDTDGEVDADDSSMDGVVFGGDVGAPTTAPVAPTQSPIAPTLAPVTPTQSPVAPTRAPVAPTQSPVEPTPAPISPTPAPITPIQSPVEPTSAPVAPTTAPIAPTLSPVEPTPAPISPTPPPIPPTKSPVQPSPAPITPTAAPISPTSAPTTPDPIVVITTPDTDPSETVNSNGNGAMENVDLDSENVDLSNNEGEVGDSADPSQNEASDNTGPAGGGDNTGPAGGDAVGENADTAPSDMSKGTDSGVIVDEEDSDRTVRIIVAFGIPFIVAVALALLLTKDRRRENMTSAEYYQREGVIVGAGFDGQSAYNLGTIPEGEVYEDRGFPPAIGQRFESMDVHRCTSVTCTRCNPSIVRDPTFIRTEREIIRAYDYPPYRYEVNDPALDGYAYPVHDGSPASTNDSYDEPSLGSYDDPSLDDYIVEDQMEV